MVLCPIYCLNCCCPGFMKTEPAEVKEFFLSMWGLVGRFPSF
jgi:hypothetical protein